MVHHTSMTMPGPSATCLLIGLVVGLLLLTLGESTAAIVVFVAEALGWAALYAGTSSKSD